MRLLNKDTVLKKVEELHLLYENGVLSHPNWYIPSNEKRFVVIHEMLFEGKTKMKLSINEVAALLLKHELLDLDE